MMISSVHSSNIDNSSQIRILRHNNQILQQQIRQLKSRCNNNIKQQEIWQQIQQQLNHNTQIKNKQSSDIDQQKKLLIRQQSNDKIKALNEQITYLKKQLIAAMSERQDAISQLVNIQQKNNDLRYNNQELKALNEKTNEIHYKQMMIIKSQKQEYANKMQEIQNENDNLTIKLQQCKQIVKQMQEFYLKEFQKIKQQKRSLIAENQNYKCTVIEITEQKQQITKDLQDYKSQFQSIINEISNKHHKEKQQSSFSNMIINQSKEKRWELKLQQMEQNYEREILNLKDNLKYVLLKLQSYEAVPRKSSEICNTQETINIPLRLSQNKTKNNQNVLFKYQQPQKQSFSSSIKQTLTRRDANILKNSNKQKIFEL